MSTTSVGVILENGSFVIPDIVMDPGDNFIEFHSSPVKNPGWYFTGITIWLHGGGKPEPGWVGGPEGATPSGARPPFPFYARVPSPFSARVFADRIRVEDNYDGSAEVHYNYALYGVTFPGGIPITHDPEIVNRGARKK